MSDWLVLLEYQIGHSKGRARLAQLEVALASTPQSTPSLPKLNLLAKPLLPCLIIIRHVHETPT
jgi:hypothetical protein